MNHSRVFAFLLGIFLAVACAGCFHGETFSEWCDQNFSDNPNGALVVSLNDTMVDAASAAYVRSMLKDIEARKGFRRKVRLIPSQNLHGFINNSRSRDTQEVRRTFARQVSLRLFAAFNSLRDFELVTDEVVDNNGMTTAQDATVPSDVYSLVYDITVLNLTSRKETAETDERGRVTKTVTVYDAATEVSLSLLDPSGKQRLFFHVQPQLQGCETPNGAVDALGNEVTSALAAEYGRQTAPPAYVTEMRGNGLFARISIGTDYGVVVGSPIVFSTIINGNDPISGQAVTKREPVGDGVVLSVARDSAWVKVDLFHYRQVHTGTLATP